MEDFEATYRAVESRDARWDGRIFIGVTSTGIFCRPICPVPMPRREHVRFYRTAAAAEHAGFRACRRCRPEESPDSPDWDVRSDLVGRALRLIATGFVDDEGVDALADRLAVSARHLHRLFVEELGVGPREVAQTRRAGLAKQLLEQSELSSTDVAFAAGFRSLRAYNEAIRRSFGRSPTEIRARRSLPGAATPPARVTLRLAYRPPLAVDELLAFIDARAIPGVERVDGTTYARAVRTAEGPRALVLRIGQDSPAVQLSVDGVGAGELASLVRRARRFLDLDADPATVDAALATEEPLRSLVAAVPGRRLPGAFEAWETTVLAVLGQGTSLAAARRAAGRLAEAHGEPVDVGVPGIDRLFPLPAVLAQAELDAVRLGIPARRAATIVALARAVAQRRLDLETGDPRESLAALRAIPGIGPWTAGYVALRVLRDPDATLPGDAAVAAGLRRLGCDATPATVERLFASWRPWRGYAVAHLWAVSARRDRPPTSGSSDRATVSG